MTPNIFITENAREEFDAALAGAGEDAGIRFAAQRASPVSLYYELEPIPADTRSQRDIEIVVKGLRFWVDPTSAKLVDGTTIDYRREADAEGFAFTNPNDLQRKDWSDPVAARFQALLDSDINPSIAAHEGSITLVSYEDGVAVVYMEGSCQGCGLAAETLRESVQARVMEAIPEISEIVDATDHEAGISPYY